MSITLVPQAGQVSALRSFQRSKVEDAATKTGGQAQVQDQIELSTEGQQAAASFGMNSITADDFMVKAREQLSTQKLEVNWNAAVDPDGQIWCKAYFDSYASQVTQFRDTAESAVKSYYSDAYQEVLNNPLGASLPQQLNFIAAKYQCSWSDYFDASMPTAERQWAYKQLRAMLTDTGLHINDPYALKGIHIPTSEETTEIARKAANDKISELVRQAKEATGISE